MIISKIKLFFENTVISVTANTDKNTREHTYKIATAALLMEMVYTDSHIKWVEKEAVTDTIRDFFGLSDEETLRLVELAEDEAREAVCLYEFTNLINNHYSYEEKTRVLEMMWKVALSDEELEKNEEYLVRKVSELLHISHSDFIRTKLQVMEKN